LTDGEEKMGRARTAIEQDEQRAQWVGRLKRFETDGRTVAAFCTAEGVSSWSFYTWRKRLGAAQDTEQTKPARGFIDAGVARMVPTGSRLMLPPALSAGGVEVQIELGGGVLLRVVRR
jgi:hypothetical protein